MISESEALRMLEDEMGVMPPRIHVAPLALKAAIRAIQRASALPRPGTAPTPPPQQPYFWLGDGA